MIYNWLVLAIILFFLYLMLLQFVSVYQVIRVFRIWPVLTPYYGRRAEDASPGPEVRWRNLVNLPRPRPKKMPSPRLGISAEGIWLEPIKEMPPETYPMLYIPWTEIDRMRRLTIPLMPGRGTVAMNLPKAQTALQVPLAALGPQSQWPSELRWALQRRGA